jgi:hypothetical protein
MEISQRNLFPKLINTNKTEEKIRKLRRKRESNINFIKK